jgi:hypothetical protein
VRSCPRCLCTCSRKRTTVRDMSMDWDRSHGSSPWLLYHPDPDPATVIDRAQLIFHPEDYRYETQWCRSVRRSGLLDYGCVVCPADVRTVGRVNVQPYTMTRRIRFSNSKLVVIDIQADIDPSSTELKRSWRARRHLYPEMHKPRCAIVSDDAGPGAV